MRARWIIACLVCGTALVVGDLGATRSTGAAGTAAGLPAPITLGGVAGVQPDMSAEQVRRRWRLNFPIIVHSSGSGFEAHAPLCKQRVRGVAFFTGAGSGVRRLYFRVAWFLAGMQTDRGIRVGSTVADLKRAYGNALQRPASNLYRVSRGPGKKNAIAFSTSEDGSSTGNRVTLIGFGWSGLMDYGPEPHPVVVHC